MGHRAVAPAGRRLAPGTAHRRCPRPTRLLDPASAAERVSTAAAAELLRGGALGCDVCGSWNSWRPGPDDEAPAAGGAGASEE
ncbi:hypothetical protein NKH77_55870 [Streptomyces sp. M19]